MSYIFGIFRECVQAIRDGKLLERDGRKSKELHFQNWFKSRLENMGENFDERGRISYPDFRMVRQVEGFELKGLAYPGREIDYDCNSQVPCGVHNGRDVYYMFGRYPKNPDGSRNPVLDLLICYGSFLNAQNTYVHKNKSFHGFGSYGVILVRDRKMYVAPTSFALVEGTAHRRSLILPVGTEVVTDLVEIAKLTRREAGQMVVAYQFDLCTNEINTTFVPNSSAGGEHDFKIYRLDGNPAEGVILVERSREKAQEAKGSGALEIEDGN